MKNFVCIGLVLFLGTVAVYGYGPKNNHKHHGPPPKPSHGSHRGPPPPHHGSHGPHHRPPPPHGYYPPWEDNAPVWGDGSDEYDDSGPDSYGPDSYGPDSRGPDYSGSSNEDYGDWYDYSHHHHHHHHGKKPFKEPTRKPPKTTPRPTKPPRPSTPHVTTRSTPRPVTTTKASTPHATGTVGPVPRPSTPVPKPTGPTLNPNTPTEDTNYWETTTSLIPKTNPPVTAETTTISTDLSNCMESCASTNEYNPVCGTNGVTYHNSGKLFCAKDCGVDVSVRRRSACPPPKPDNNLPPTSPPTTETTPSFMGRTTPLGSFHRCMKQCEITPAFLPVCGTDLITYMNIDRLKCAQGCGELVEVLCEKPCAACGFNPVTVKPTTTTLAPTTGGNVGKTTMEPDIKECIKACPVTQEYNPVCGSDNVTYKNPGHLLCAQMCGFGVIVSRLAPCTTGSTTSTTTEFDFFSTASPDIPSCIQRCPVVTNYDPVCGTDGLTYTNMGNLECSRYCGVDVEFKYKSRCLNEFDLNTGGTDSTPSQTTPDINGSKDVVTTASPTTASSTTLFTSPTTTTASKTPSTPSIPSTTLGFTIPPDILDNIFGSTTTQAPLITTTKATNPDADEDLDLDARFNNDTEGGRGGKSHLGKIIFPE